MTTIYSFNNPESIAIDSKGNVYVGGNYYSFDKITRNGQTIAQLGRGMGLAGDDNDGPASIAACKYPIAFAVDANDNLFFCDYTKYKIRKVTPDGFFSTVAGNGIQGSTDGITGAASFKTPCSVLAAQSGILYVSDFGTNRIRKIMPNGDVSTLVGNGIIGAIDSIGDQATLFNPYGMAFDKNENIFVVDAGGDKIRKITQDGKVATFAGSSGGDVNANGKNAKFNNPTSLVFDTAGNIYVSDCYNQKIKKITPNGDVSTFAGTGIIGFKDGSRLTATFSNPGGLAFDSKGNLYVCDILNNLIRVISPSGNVTTLAGGAGVKGRTNGKYKDAYFNAPISIAIDEQDNLYVADKGNNCIRKLSNGIVSTLVGSLTSIAGYADGVGVNALLNGPNGVFLDKNCNLFIAESTNNKIRKVSLSSCLVTTIDEEIKYKSESNIFPNPVENLLNVVSNLSYSSYQIFNSYGQLVQVGNNLNN